MVCVIVCHSSVGSHSNETEEVDVTIPVISSWPVPVAIPAEQADNLPASGTFSAVCLFVGCLE